MLKLELGVVRIRGVAGEEEIGDVVEGEEADIGSRGPEQESGGCAN